MTTMKKESIAAISALAALSLGLVAAGCGGDTAQGDGPGTASSTRQASAASPIPGVPRLRSQAEIDAWLAPRSNPDVRPVILYCNAGGEDVCAYFNQFPTWFHKVMDGRGIGDELRGRTAYVNTIDVPDWPYRSSTTATGTVVVRYQHGNPAGRVIPGRGREDRIWTDACRMLHDSYVLRLGYEACPDKPPKD